MLIIKSWLLFLFENEHILLMRKVGENEWGIAWSKVCNRTKGLSIIMSCKTVCLKSFTNSSRRWLLKRKIDFCTSSDEKLFRDEEVQKRGMHSGRNCHDKIRGDTSAVEKREAKRIQFKVCCWSVQVSLEKQLLNKLPSFFLMEQCFRVQLLWLEKKVYLQDMAMRERERKTCDEQTGRGWRRRWKIRSLHFHL